MSISKELPVIQLKIKCRRKNNTIYYFNRFIEYQVTVDLGEENTGSFKFSIGNVKGKYSGFISIFDRVSIFIGDDRLMTGIIDDVEYKFDEQDCLIVITGRDATWKLTDNDKPPVKKGAKTKTNVVSYIKSELSTYSISGAVNKSIPTYKGLNVGCAESRMSVINNLLADTVYKCWMLKDVFYVGEWNTKGSAVDTINESRVESANVKMTGKDLISQITCYESTKKGGYTKKQTITNSYMEKLAQKRATHKKYQEGASSSLKNSGLRKMKDAYLESLELELTIKPTTKVLLPNSCVNVNIPRLGINTKMFIRKVEWFKDFDKGTQLIVTLIPSNTSYTTMYQLGDITGEALK